jgi:cysteine synthase
LDYFVIGPGTGGSLTGIGARFKEIMKKTKIIGADPIGSLLA